MAVLAFGLPAWLAPTLEVLSDLAGAASGLMLLASGHRLLVARRALQSQREKNQRKIDALKTQLAQPPLHATSDPAALQRRVEALEQSQIELAEADASTSRYDPADLALLQRGVGLLLASFLLKLAFHVVTKGPGSG